MQFKFDDRIYAVWHPDRLSDWNPLDAYDASADGLSGNKEGFYIAGLLVPFVLPFTLNGIQISPEHHPECLNDGSDLPCTDCKFFRSSNCPILQDKANLPLSRESFQLYSELIYCPRTFDTDLFDATYLELNSHGKPLHYQMLTKILVQRHTKAAPSERKVHKILRLNPIFFTDFGDGVYKAISRRNRGKLVADSLLLYDWYRSFDIELS